ncbi:hypothetical protein ACTFIT_006214 [Dictyostelium discoideum]
MVLIKINNIDFTLVDKEKLSSIVEGKYDVTNLGEDKKLIERAIPLIFIRKRGIKLGNLCLLGEFNQEISFFKGKNGKTLLPDMSSIPDQIEINSIQFHNGFNQPISNVGPLSLTVGSIPSTVKDVHFWDGFNLPLTPGIIEDGVKLVETSTKEIVLRVGSIPRSVKTLYLRNIMTQIEPGIITNTVESLYMIGYNHNALTIGSLPNTLKELNLSTMQPQNSYVPGIIPDGLEELQISGKLELYVPPTTAVSKPSKYIYPFFPNIIPNTFTFLMTVFKYCLSLTTGTNKTSAPPTNKDQENQDQTPLSADKMNSQNSVLLIGSIPNSVRKIKLSHGFSHDLPIGIIPHSVEDLDLFEK